MKLQRAWWIGRAAAVAWGLAWLVGCEQGEKLELVPVAGVVTLDGKPLERGSVIFHAKTGDGAHQPTGRIESDGRYRLYVSGKEGAPPGWYNVTVFATGGLEAGTGHDALPKSLIDSSYHNPDTTPLELEVREAAAAGDYDLRLVTKDSAAEGDPLSEDTAAEGDPLPEDSAAEGVPQSEDTAAEGAPQSDER